MSISIREMYEEIPILYILHLEAKAMTKLGQTDKPVKDRIAGFKFGLGYKRAQKDVEVKFTHRRANAKSVEHYAHKIARSRYRKVMDKNLGSGYTEWYFCSPHQLNMCILTAINFVENYKPVKPKDRKPKNSPHQIPLI